MIALPISKLPWLGRFSELVVHAPSSSRSLHHLGSQGPTGVHLSIEKEKSVTQKDSYMRHNIGLAKSLHIMVHQTSKLLGYPS